MYLSYWEFQKFPFENVPDPNFLYLSRYHEEALSRLLYIALMRKGGGLLTGEIGCGKTTLTQALLDRLSEDRFDVGLITNPSLEPKEFLQEVLYRFNVSDVPKSKVEILQIFNNRMFRNMKEGKENLLIIDEAQTIQYATFEEIRLLLNSRLNERFLLTIILVGQPELRIKIKGMDQLEQRLPIRYHLIPFNFKETACYIIFRQKKAGSKRNVFSRQAVERIYEHTKGVPRKINNMCDLALLIGYNQKRKIIASKIIENIINDGALL